jgi:hypothetical protein
MRTPKQTATYPKKGLNHTKHYPQKGDKTMHPNNNTTNPNKKTATANINNVNHKATLSNITNSSSGTTEFEAYEDMGVERRKITGILAVKSEVGKFKWSARFIKPLAVLASSIGFAFMIMLMTEADIFSDTFWIAIGVGVIIGAFFEFIATSFEPSITSKKIDTTTNFKKRFIIFVKAYAVVMHLITAYNLPSYIINQKAENVEDTNQIKALLAKSERLKTDKSTSSMVDPRIDVLKGKIERLKGEKQNKEAEKTAKLMDNTLSTHPRKRADALEAVATINREAGEISKDISNAETKMAEVMSQGNSSKERAETDITNVEGQIAALRTENSNNKKAESSGTIGLVFVLAILLVLVEVSGTMFSVLHDKAILNGVGEEVAMTEEVKSRLYSTKVAMESRNNNIKAFEIRDSIQNNVHAVQMAEYESTVKSENIKLREVATHKEIELENARLKLESKMNDLEIFKHDKTLAIIDMKMAQIGVISNHRNTPFISNQPSISQEPTEPTRKIGFNANHESYEIITRMFQGGLIGAGQKLTPRDTVVGKPTRSKNETATRIYQELVGAGAIERKGSQGYFVTATADYQTALSVVGGV